MEKIILHTSDTRGHSNFGWLDSYHSFSFGHYYDRERIHFGALRVLNDDQVAAGMGFGKHPHDNMEIISIPLEGQLEHKDSMGNTAVIKSGDVQVMSAGTGITHSEYNKSSIDPVKFLQIWILPEKENVTPRYDQITLNKADRINTLQQILSPNRNDEGVWIHQQAWFYLGTFDQNNKVEYAFKKQGNGVYAFVIRGSFEVHGTILNNRDAVGIQGADHLTIQSLSPEAEILLMEVPMM